MKKVAILVDWENLSLEIQHFQRTNGNRRKVKFGYNNVEDVVSLIHKSIDDKKEEIYRIFFYTAEPLFLDKELEKHRDNSKIFQSIKKFLNSQNQERELHLNKLKKKIIQNIQEFSQQDYFAVRLGELKLQGFDESKGTPIINQKQVDMLLRLDISHHHRILQRY